MNRKVFTATALSAALLGAMAAQATPATLPALLQHAAQARAGNPVLVTVPANVLSPQGMVLVAQVGGHE